MLRRIFINSAFFFNKKTAKSLLACKDLALYEKTTTLITIYIFMYHHLNVIAVQFVMLVYTRGYNFITSIYIYICAGCRLECTYVHLWKGLRSDANSCRKAWLNYVALRLMPDNDIRIPRQFRQLDAYVSPLDNSRDRPPSCSARAHNMGGDWCVFKDRGCRNYDMPMSIVCRHNRAYMFVTFVCGITIDVKVSDEWRFIKTYH